MNLTITPYKAFSKAALIVAIIASLILIVFGFASDIGYLCFVLLVVIWMMPLIFLLVDKLHGNRSVTITDDEIVFQNIARTETRELVFGGFIDFVAVKKKDIVGVEKDFQFVLINPIASKSNIVVTTKKQAYIIDGRLIDAEVVRLALTNNTQAALERFEKKSKQAKLVALIGTIFESVFVDAIVVLL